MLEVVAVTRAAIARDGWPENWEALYRRACSEVSQTLDEGQGRDPEYLVMHLTLGDLVSRAYDAKDEHAYFRQVSGSEQAFLVAQGWVAS